MHILSTVASYSLINGVIMVNSRMFEVKIFQTCFRQVIDGFYVYWPQFTGGITHPLLQYITPHWWICVYVVSMSIDHSSQEVLHILYYSRYITPHCWICVYVVFAKLIGGWVVLNCYPIGHLLDLSILYLKARLETLVLHVCNRAISLFLLLCMLTIELFPYSYFYTCSQ